MADSSLNIQFLLLICLFVVNGATEEDSGHMISEWCLDCLQRIQPDEVECIPHPSIASQQLCGDYKMSELFYDDCIHFLNASLLVLPHDWMTYKGCYKDSTCSRECVRSYHNFWGIQCMTILGRPLVCADFGKIHSTGPHTCHTQPTELSDSFILNMTLACGCQTVYENRANCLTTPAPVTSAPGLTDETVIIVVICICVLILAAAIIGCVICLRRQAALVQSNAATVATGMMRRTKTDYTSSPQNQPRSRDNGSGGGSVVNENGRQEREHVYLNTRKDADV